MTSLIASGFGSAPLWGSPDFFQSWLRAWALSWAVMLPVVLLAAPWIRKLAHALTKEDDARITPP